MEKIAPANRAHMPGQQLLVASMVYLLRRGISQVDSEQIVTVALLVLWTLMFFAMSCRTLASAEVGGPPVRIDNIYGGLDHQPTQSEVQDRERDAGVGLNTTQQQRNAATVDRLYEQLLGRAPANHAAGEAASNP